MHDFKVFPQVFIAMIASGGSFLYGTALGWSSSAGVKIHYEYDLDISLNQFAWSVSMLSLGAASTCVLSGIIRNRYGSKKTILLFSFPNIFGWSLLIFAQNALMIIFGRLLIGMGCGAYCFNVPIYIGEIASKQIRGTLLTFFEISLKTGILFAYVLGFVTKLYVTNIICFFIVIIYGLIFMFVPETPMFLMSKNKIEEMKSSLTFLRGKGTNIQKEMEELQEQLNELESSQKSFINELKKPATRKAFIIIIFMFLFFQLSGINAIVFYSATIFIESGIKLDPFFASSILGLIQVFGVLMTTFSVDRFGRKILLAVAFIIMIFGLVGNGLYFSMKTSSSIFDGYEFLTILMLCLFLIGFSLGIGSISFVLLGELFSLSAKKIVAPMAQTTNFLMSFIVAMLFPTITNAIGIQYTFFMFAACCLLGLIFVVTVLPETKGKSFCEIQKLLTNEK